MLCFCYDIYIPSYITNIIILACYSICYVMLTCKRHVRETDHSNVVVCEYPLASMFRYVLGISIVVPRIPDMHRV